MSTEANEETVPKPGPHLYHLGADGAEGGANEPVKLVDVPSAASAPEPAEDAGKPAEDAGESAEKAAPAPRVEEPEPELPAPSPAPAGEAQQAPAEDAGEPAGKAAPAPRVEEPEPELPAPSPAPAATGREVEVKKDASVTALPDRSGESQRRQEIATEVARRVQEVEGVTGIYPGRLSAWRHMVNAPEHRLIDLDVSDRECRVRLGLASGVNVADTLSEVARQLRAILTESGLTDPTIEVTAVTIE